MAEFKKERSPCARCEHAWEYEWPERLAIYCDAIPYGRRLIETQRLKNPRGSVQMVTEGPLENCPIYGGKKRDAV